MAAISTDLNAALNSIFQRLSVVEQGVTSPGVVNQNVFKEILLTDGTTNWTLKTTQEPPTNLVAYVGHYYDSTFLDLDWTVAKGASNYQVEVAKKDTLHNTYAIAQTRQTNSNTIRIEGLDAGSTYGARVIAFSPIGVPSAPTPTNSFLDVYMGWDSTLPPSVKNVTAARGATSIIVKFDPLTSTEAADVANGNGLYEVQVSSNEFFATVDRVTTSSSFVVAFNDIITPTDYWARVRAIDSSGNAGPWSAASPAIKAGGVNDAMIIADLSAAKITFGTMSGDRIDTNSLNANRITTSELTSANIILAGGQISAGNPPLYGLSISASGLQLYNGGTITTSLDAITGDAYFRGTVSASTVVGSQLYGGYIWGSYFETEEQLKVRFHIGTLDPPSIYNAALKGDLVWDVNVNGNTTAAVISTTTEMPQNGDILNARDLILQGPFLHTSNRWFKIAETTTNPNPAAVDFTYKPAYIRLRSNTDKGLTDQSLEMGIFGSTSARFYATEAWFGYGKMTGTVGQGNTSFGWQSWMQISDMQVRFLVNYNPGVSNIPEVIFSGYDTGKISLRLADKSNIDLGYIKIDTYNGVDLKYKTSRIRLLDTNVSFIMNGNNLLFMTNTTGAFGGTISGTTATSTFDTASSVAQVLSQYGNVRTRAWAEAKLSKASLEALTISTGINNEFRVTTAGFDMFSGGVQLAAFYRSGSVNYMNFYGIPTFTGTPTVVVMDPGGWFLQRNASSMKLKKRIQSIFQEIDISSIDNIRPIAFNGTHVDPSGNGIRKVAERRSLGFGAENMAEDFPLATIYDEGEPMGVHDTAVLALVVATIQDLRKRIKKLERG